MSARLDIWKFVRKGEDDDACWVWTGFVDPKTGYGRFRQSGAHRAMYFLIYGVIDPWLHVCHKCNNKPCVRPTHLYARTPKQNTQDALRAGTLFIPPLHGCAPKGVQNGHAKLDDRSVLELRKFRAAGWSQNQLADHYAVSRRTIRGVLSGNIWQHV